jgi:outer membrane protein TolC
VLDAELEVFKATAGMVQAQVDALEALINLRKSL